MSTTSGVTTPPQWSDIVAAVAAQTTEVATVATFIAGLKPQLAAIGPAPTAAQVQAVLDGLSANTNALIAAAPPPTASPVTPAAATAAAAAGSAVMAGPTPPVSGPAAASAVAM